MPGIPGITGIISPIIPYYYIDRLIQELLSIIERPIEIEPVIDGD
jgi:hypothetical protein